MYFVIGLRMFQDLRSASDRQAICSVCESVVKSAGLSCEASGWRDTAPWLGPVITSRESGSGNPALDHPSTTAAISCAASACIPGTTWAYCFSVNAGDSCPSRSLMTLTGTPALTAIVA